MVIFIKTDIKKARDAIPRDRKGAEEGEGHGDPVNREAQARGESRKRRHEGHHGSAGTRGIAAGAEAGAESGGTGSSPPPPFIRRPCSRKTKRRKTYIRYFDEFVIDTNTFDEIPCRP